MNKQYIKAAIIDATDKFFKNLNHVLKSIKGANASSFLDKRRKKSLNKIINTSIKDHHRQNNWNRIFERHKIVKMVASRWLSKNSTTGLSSWNLFRKLSSLAAVSSKKRNWRGTSRLLMFFNKTRQLLVCLGPPRPSSFSELFWQHLRSSAYEWSKKNRK